MAKKKHDETHVETHFEPVAKRVLPNGIVKYYPISQNEPDTQETLIKAGLMKVKRKKPGDIEYIVPNPPHLRVVCWMAGINAACRKAGEPEAFPGLGINIISGEPRGSA